MSVKGLFRNGIVPAYRIGVMRQIATNDESPLKSIGCQPPRFSPSQMMLKQIHLLDGRVVTAGEATDAEFRAFACDMAERLQATLQQWSEVSLLPDALVEACDVYARWYVLLEFARFISTKKVGIELFVGEASK